MRMTRTTFRGTSVLSVLLLPCLLLAQQEPLVLHDGTPVRLRLNRSLSSADTKAGDTADFEVLEDVTLGDTLVIARGATAIATVTAAQEKRRMARGGKIDINIDYVRLVTNEKVALRAVREAKGGGHTGAMTGAIVATSLVFFPAAPFFLFWHGKDATIPKGTELTAYVEGDVKLDPVKWASRAGISTSAAITMMTPDSSPTAKPMTNQDVIALKTAGLSDDFVIARIKISPSSYKLDTEDIIALKKSNLTEPIIQAMMAAGASAEPKSTATLDGEAAPLHASLETNEPAKKGLLTKMKEVFVGPPEQYKPAAQPTAPAPAPVPPQSVLTPVTVLSKPAGASILVDGYPAGVTPAVVKLLPGTYKLTLKAPGCPEYSQQITVESGQVRSFGVALEGSKEGSK
jgi:PEGA domain